MEAFSRMLGALTSRGLISGFFVGSSEPNRVNVSHLLFADDTLVSCGANASQIKHIGAVLLGCGTGDLPLKYLGLSLGASFKLKAM